ncbi:MAG: hypothetical protein Q8R08_01545, partial [bacterium]|nr:hypothetical protein [bacterium]
DLTITAGTLSGTNNVTVSGGDATGAGTIKLTGGTFTLDGAGSFGGSSAWIFSSLTFGDGSNAATSTASGTGGITVSSTLSVTNNQGLDAGSKTWTLSGAGTALSVAGGFTGNTSNFAYTSGSGLSALASRDMTGSYAYYNLTINGTGTFTAGVDITVSNDLSLTGGTLAGTNNITVNGGDASGSGLVNLTGGTFTLDGTGTFADASNLTFYNLTFGDGSGSAVTTTSSGNSGVTVTGVLTIAANQTLNASSKTWTLSGSGTPLVISGTFTASNSTIDYTGTSATTIAVATYNNLGVKPGANSITHTFTAGTATVNGNLTLGNGTNTGVNVTAASNSTVLDVNGALTIAANTTLTAHGSNSFAVAGSWTNNGTFTHNSGTITFDTTGTSVISGATTFNNFTSTTAGKTLQFQRQTDSAPVFTFNGTFNVSGSGGVGNKVNIQSDLAGTQWLAHFTNAQSSVNHADIKDSGCNVGSANVNLTGSSRNGGNNGACWVFVAASQGGGGAPTDGGSGGGTPQGGGGGSGGGGSALGAQENIDQSSNQGFWSRLFENIKRIFR